MLPLLPIALRLVSPIVTSVILDHLAQFKDSLNWTTLKIDLNKKIRSVVPNSMLSDAVVLFADRMVSNVYEALRDTTEQQKVIALVLKGDWETAGQEILKYAFPNVVTPVAVAAP